MSVVTETFNNDFEPCKRVPAIVTRLCTLLKHDSILNVADPMPLDCGHPKTRDRVYPCFHLDERFIEQHILEIHGQHPLKFYFFEILSVRLRL